MRVLLARLGNPERELDTIHVVGTKGKSTAARRLAATVGGRAYTSPHVSGWHERLQTDPDAFAPRRRSSARRSSRSSLRPRSPTSPRAA
jgi:folylpolyglutamate synthase/dihydropteroate synthase